MTSTISCKKSGISHDIIQLVYCSRISKEIPEFLASKKIEEIVEYSKFYNPLYSITSALMTDMRAVAQVIEGPSPEINRLYRSILCDKRHHNMILLQRTVTNVRLFQHWPMALVQVDAMPWIHKLSIQSTPTELRAACVSILRGFWPVLCGE